MKSISESQTKASRNYLKKGHFINVFFPESETGLYNRICDASKYYGIGRATYIKSVLKGEKHGKN